MQEEWSKQVGDPSGKRSLGRKRLRSRSPALCHGNGNRKPHSATSSTTTNNNNDNNNNYCCCCCCYDNNNK